MSTFEMLSNANVEITASRNAKNHPIAIATINGEHQHRFDPNSRISKALELMTPADLAARMTGGHYFMVNGDLVDFRDGQYTGFVHNNDNIQRLVETIGVTEGSGRKTTRENTTSTKVSLSKIWSETDIAVPLYNEGGNFKSQLRFAWNPFMKDVRSAFELVRLICTNGMTGLTSFLNTKIPLVNRWEEHLEIASRQIQNKVSSKIITRLTEMGTERATVSDCQLIVEHANDRLEDGNLDQATRQRLKNIGMIASPSLHLGSMYRENVFSDKRLGAQLPSHLSSFDIYNMATEIRSHTQENSKSSNHAMDKMANALVFDREDLTQHTARFGKPTLAGFDDPEAAFFG